MVTVSLCMIVKDDEKFLEKLLAAIHYYVDEIVIVLDRSCSDEIARKYTEKIILHEWKQSFSEARNISLEKATGDLILVLDADEIISADDLEKLKSMAGEGSVAFSLLQCTYSNDSNNPHWTAADNIFTRKFGFSGCIVVPTIRFFRNGMGIKFSRRVHELADGSLQELGLSSKIKRTNIPIHHLKYVKGEEYAREKESLYMELSKKELEDNPGSYKAYFDIGVVSLAQKNSAAAEENFLKSLQINPSNPLALFNLAAVYLELKAYEKAAACYQRALELDPDAKIIYKSMGLLYYRMQQYEKALEFYEKYYRSTGDEKILSVISDTREKMNGATS